MATPNEDALETSGPTGRHREAKLCQRTLHTVTPSGHCLWTPPRCRWGAPGPWPPATMSTCWLPACPLDHRHAGMPVFRYFPFFRSFWPNSFPVFRYSLCSPISSFSFWTFCLFLCSFSVRRHSHVDFQLFSQKSSGIPGHGLVVRCVAREREIGNRSSPFPVKSYQWLNLCRMPWVQKHPRLWFLPCNSGDVHATCTKFYDFVDKVACYISTETPWVSMDPQRMGKVCSFIYAMGLFEPSTYETCSFVHKTPAAYVAV